MFHYLNRITKFFYYHKCIRFFFLFFLNCLFKLRHSIFAQIANKINKIIQKIIWKKLTEYFLFFWFLSPWTRWCSLEEAKIYHLIKICLEKVWFAFPICISVSNLHFNDFNRTFKKNVSQIYRDLFCPFSDIITWHLD